LLREENISKMNIGSFLFDSMVLWLGFPIYLIAILSSCIPFLYAHWLCKRKVKKAEFTASFFVNIAMLLWIFFMCFQLIATLFIWHNIFLSLLYFTTAVSSGLFTLWYRKQCKRIFGRLRLLKLVRKQRSEVESLIQMRGEIVHQLKELLT